jgi:hypothetical protein
MVSNLPSNLDSYPCIAFGSPSFCVHAEMCAILQELYVSQDKEWYIIWFLTQESIGFNFCFWVNFHNLVAKKKSVNWTKKLKNEK